MDQHEEQKPFTYDSVAQAIDAILAYDALRSSSTPAVNWQAVAAVIGEVNDLSLDPATFSQLQKKTRVYAGRDFFKILDQWGDANWLVVKDVLLEQARTYFGAEYGERFIHFIAQWPRLKNDVELLDLLIGTMRYNLRLLGKYVSELRALQHDQAAAQRVLAVVMDASTFFEKRDEFAALIHQWAGHGTWGQLQILLWRQKLESESPTLAARNVERVAALLKEFGILASPNNYRLSDLSAESRASWRRELKVAVGSDQELRYATAESLLGLGSPADDRAVLFAVSELYYEGLGDELSSFLSHPNALVSRRTRAVIDMFNLEPDALSLLQARRRPVSSNVPSSVRTLHKPRTWIGDAYVEKLIENALDEAALVAGHNILSTLDSGEETHVMLLLGELKTAFQTISGLLLDLAVESDAQSRLSFGLDLDYRVIGKPEEGGAGISTETFATDVCLLIEVRDAGNTFARRTSLLQAKRLYSPDVRPYYPIKMKQLEDLSRQTFASFLVLLGPECDGIKIPIIPARLMLDLIASGQPSTQIAPQKASVLGKGIGTWLLEDVIGLWTGDWAEPVVARGNGNGEKYRQPLVLARLVVDRIHKGSDGWGNSRRLQ